ncbi:MAG TPA: hypothetical protein VIM11_25925 [Tepidisphaeraceae bacterium]|jgi:ferric-dicitrate binding protein FerR (iron transport regulator)
MRHILSLAFVAVAFVLMFAGSANAAPGAKVGKGVSKTSTVSGTVVGYQENKHAKKLVVSVANDDGKTEERSIKLDDSTKLTLDGQSIAASALRAGEKVTITLTRKIATQITATSN